jgi:ferrous iron transport protein A
MNLSHLTKGQEAVIISISDSPISLKLLEMGCIPGERVKMENIAPLGDPVAISVSGYKLSLRLDEASFILVKLIIPGKEDIAA